ncbi:hypothetical protein ACFWUZ_17340 [Streptomyces sp. NPDC058646]|uniref:hypothetical protein n=1 Tax=Streptomyces sp. NPDC058646 TaxID=3346574 RepID=UPI00365E7758
MDTTKTPAPDAPEADTTPADLVKGEDPRPGENASGTGAAAHTADGAGLTDATTDATRDDEESGEEFDEDLAEDEEQTGGVAAAAAAIVAAGLSLVALSGSWASRVLAERQGLTGQIHGDKSAPPAEQIAALYGDGWQLTSLVNGVMATVALLIAAFVLARPAFGTPGRTLPVWVRAVSWAAVVLGAIGVLVFGFLYFLPLPKVPA